MSVEFNKHYRRLYVAGFVGFLLLIAMSLYYYKERTAFIDIAYHLFFLLKEGDLAIQNYRFVAAATQVFPLTGSAMGLSLTAIMKLYSVAFPILFVAGYWICGTVLNNKKGAFLLLFTTFLICTDTFYWIQSELQQGLVFLVILFAWLSRDVCSSLLFWLIAALLCIVVLFAHPLLLFPLCYGLAFLFLQDQTKGRKTTLVVVLLMAVMIWVAKKLVFKTSYDDTAMGNLKKFVTFFPDYIHLATNKQLLSDFLSKYYGIPVFSCLIVFFYVRSRSWKMLLLFLGFMTGYLLLINVSYEGSAAEPFYMENMYLPASIFIALPIVFQLAQRPGYSRITHILMLAMVAVALLRMVIAGRPFAQRLAWMETFLQQHAGEKLVVDEKLVPKNTLMMTWATPYEFWLLSTPNTGKTASLVITENVDQLNWTIERKDAFVTVWGVYPYSEFKSPYFQFTDSSSSYRQMH